MRKDHVLHLRVSDKDLKKLRQIANLTDGNMSDAVRLAIHRFSFAATPMVIAESDMIDVAGIRAAYNEYLADSDNA